MTWKPRKGETRRPADSYRGAARNKTVTCFWFRRKMGCVAEKVDITLSPAACRRYRIWVPQSLHPERAERIATWMAAQETG